MWSSILFFLFSLLIFFILTEKVTVILQYDKKLCVKIGLTLFAIEFHSSGRKEKRRKRNKHHKKSKYLNRLNLFCEILQKSNLHIETIDIIIPRSIPSNDAIRYVYINTFLSYIIYTCEENTNFFSSRDITVDFSAHNKLNVTLDVQIEFSLLDFLICATLNFFESFKSKSNEKRGKKHGRKQHG